jgi:hypothetical protein
MKRFLICAGDHRQADTLAWTMKMAKSEWSYVDGSDRLLGMRGMTLLMWGTWEARKDMPEILMTAKAMEMTVLYVDDRRR